ncbi:MAG: (Fe-S)-binding protein [Defluviitaleaceae bacterium]|nr:(Fe-S)-binding protein [Defluviitaleaceae bacterium]
MSRKAFMPGCALASYNPENVSKMTAHLKSVYPDLSVVQKCCGKPTQAIGQADLFNERYASLAADMRFVEADDVIVACQSCMNVFNKKGEFNIVSLWELLPKIGLPKEMVGKAKGSDVVFSVHDSCSVRPYTGIHEGIRWILDELGYKHVEPEKTRDTTRCCGFGGMIVPVSPDIAKKVMERRVSDMTTDHIVAYCAACRQSMLKVGGKAWHIMDLIFGEVVHATTDPPFDVLASPAKAWKNRYRSKKMLNKVMKG